MTLIRASLIVVMATVFGVATVVSASAQDLPDAFAKQLRDLEESRFGILSNSVTNLHAHGDSLWVGPFLNLTTDGGQTWKVADADSLIGTANRVFSIDIEASTIWVGLGFVDNASGDGVQSAGGFVFSTDGGNTWSYRSTQLDRPGETTVQYGVSTLEALDIIVPQQSPPFDIDFDPAGDLWVAGWASGVRRSSDGGATWRRVVLPPDTLDAIHPDTAYMFRIEPRRGTTGWLNHMGFSVLIDEAGTVWAGTPAGVNRSLDGGLSWRRFSADGSPDRLTGSWVISIEEQQLPGRNAIWMATWNAGEAGENGRFGVTVTRDGGETFEQMLIGERVFDFAFEDGYVYAAADNGVFISSDDGATWTAVRYFVDAQDPELSLRADLRVFSVATTRDAVWVGTSDGLVKSTDHGATWRVFRINVPLNPDEPSASVPRVDSYAYPNPFSPAADLFVRIRYEDAGAGDTRLRVFDFGMNLIDEISPGSKPAGLTEVRWGGTSNDGLRVPNGVYFYTVETGGRSAWGKILLIE